MSKMEDYQISRTDGPAAFFQKHFASLTSSQEFTDVTLVCRDLKPVPLHRVILSASSLWFRSVVFADSLTSINLVQEPPSKAAGQADNLPGQHRPPCPRPYPGLHVQGGGQGSQDPALQLHGGRQCPHD